MRLSIAVSVAVALCTAFLWSLTRRTEGAPASAPAEALRSTGAAPAPEVAGGSAALEASAAARAERAPVAAEPAAAASQASTPEATPVDAKAEERDKILVRLHVPGLEASEQSHLWRRLAELGLADDAITALQRELEQRPLDSHLHEMLGNAHVTKLRSQALSPTQRHAESAAALRSFDRALELDPQNWTARFSRAMSNSQAPAFLGRGKAAIDDFEKLLEQQKQGPLSKDHAHTYFFLGNLHEGAGHTEQAAKVRTEARRLFPEDPRFQ